MVSEKVLFDVFISYRRKGGAEHAQLVKSELRQRGVAENRIFLDTHSLHEGDFRQKIENAIRQSNNVIVIISKGCFDEVRDTDYWYMEIREAMKQGKRIIPVLFDSILSLDLLPIPSDLNELKNRNFIRYQHEYADATFDKLLSFLAIENTHPIIKSSTNRGCLMKYRGCMFSIVLVALLVVVVVPVVFFNQQSPTQDQTAMANDDDEEKDTLSGEQTKRIKLPSSQENDDNINLASSKLKQIESATKTNVSKPTNTKKLSWAIYSGEMKDGAFHGYGVLKITKQHNINNDVAYPDESIDGEFRNGQIKMAVWYKKNGKKVLLKDTKL